MTTSPSNSELIAAHNALLDLHREIRQSEGHKQRRRIMNQRADELKTAEINVELARQSMGAFVQKEYGERLAAANAAFEAAGGLPTLLPLR